MNVVYVSFITRTIYSHSLGLDLNQLQEHVSLFSKTQQHLFTGTLACSVRLLKSLIFFFLRGRKEDKIESSWDLNPGPLG